MDGSVSRVDVAINGQPARLLLDTAASGVVLNQAAESRLGLSSAGTGNGPVYGTNGPLLASGARLTG